jgi:nicotinate-nucleotide adenylyltransferase
MLAAPSPYLSNLWANRTVGLLGGSFNPAHEGHRHISLYALKHLGLDAVWWMVSPQNPLKSSKDMAPLKDRIAGAVKASHHPKIIVTDIEQRLHTRYTADTLEALQKHFSSTRFVWLMGGDNLRQIHRWQEWENIFGRVPVAVLDRPPRGNTVKTCPAIERFRAFLQPQERAQLITTQKPPCWTILHIPLNELSATQIRAKRKLRR